MSVAGVSQLEPALELVGTDLLDAARRGEPVMEAMMLRMESFERVASDPSEALEALLGLEALFNMVLLRLAMHTDSDHAQTRKDFLDHARFVLESARQIELDLKKQS